MKIEDVRVGMSVGYKDVGVVTRIEDNKVWARWSNGEEQFVCANSIEPEHIPTQQPSLANTKIDVQKYADTYGITLEQAHQEIQPWLFEQGVVWSATGLAFVTNSETRYLYIDSGELSYSRAFNAGFFKCHKNKEITPQRNVSISISIAPPEPYVELDGKQYTKAQILAALAKLEEK